MFSFRTAINVRFGHGITNGLGEELKKNNFSHVLFVIDPGLKRTSIADQAIGSLKINDVKCEIIDTVEPNPRDVTVEKAWESVKDKPIDAVLGFGGGSALDAAKAAALLATNGGPLRQYNDPAAIKKPALPIIAVPTTAGTGSEVTSNAAITDSKNHYKMSFRSPYLIPALSFLDPNLLSTLPKGIAAESSMDAIIHAAEAYLSKKSNPVSDALAVEALKFLCPNIRPFVANRANKSAAESMLLGSMLAGTVIGNTGTGNAHALARALGGEYDLAHGLGCSIMFPYVVRFNFIANPPKYRNFAGLLGLNVSNCSDSSVREKLVEELFVLLEQLGVPSKLGSAGLDKVDVGKVAEIAAGNTGPNPRTTTVEDLKQLLHETE